MVTTNIKSVDFLDLNLNLKTEPYKPFKKPNNDPIYIYIYRYLDINLNYPPQILKQLPKSISKNLSENLSSKEVFDKSKPVSENSANNSGFYENLSGQQKQKSTQKYEETRTQNNMVPSAIF